MSRSRLVLVVAKRHHRSRAYGWSVVAFQSANHFGLIRLDDPLSPPDPTGPVGLAGKTECRR